MDNRPCYYITDGEGIDATAYVANPAILRKGVALEGQEPPKFKFADTLKLQVAAPVLIPDMKIYRRDDELGEYDVAFTKERILSLHTKQKLEGKGDRFNLDHDSNEPAQSVILYEWIVQDGNTDLSHTQYGLDPLPQGSLFRVTQFPESQREFFMKEIVEGDRAAFSIEGYLGLEMERIREKIKQEKQNKMKKNRFEKVATADGCEVFVDGAVAVDSYVYSAYPTVQLIDGKRSEIQNPVWDPIIELADGTILTLEDGKIVVVEQKAASAEPASTDTTPAADVTPAPAETTQAKTETEKEMNTNETKLADAIPAETPAQGTPANDNSAPAADDAKQDNEAIMAIVKPMFDEVYKKIAELQTMIESADAAPADDQQMDATKLSNQRASSVESLVAFLKSTH